jgi:hypothetical protein
MFSSQNNLNFKAWNPDNILVTGWDTFQDHTISTEEAIILSGKHTGIKPKEYIIILIQTLIS